MSNKNVTSIGEDSQGNIWIGTNRGLNKYNGKDYMQYFHTSDTTSISNNHINDIHLDKKDRLWVATVNGVSQYTDQDVFRHVEIKSPSKNAISFVETHDGDVFLNMNLYLCKYNERTDAFDFVMDNLDPKYDFKTKVYADVSNRLWVVNPELIRSYAASTLKLVDSVPLDGHYEYSHMRANGEIWMWGKRDVMIFDTRRGCFKAVPREVINAYASHMETINHIASYGNDGIMVFAPNGAAWYDGEQIVYGSDRRFPFDIPDFCISTSFRDSGGNLWLGSEDQGVTTIYRNTERFSNNRFLRNAFDHQSVTSLAKDSHNAMYISSKMHGVQKYDHLIQGLVDFPEIDKVIKDNPVRKIYIDSDDQLWILAETAVFRVAIQDNKVTDIHRLPIAFAYSITEDNDGKVWIGGRFQSIFAVDGKTMETREYPVFPQTYVNTCGLVMIDPHRLLAASFEQPLKIIDTHTGAVSESKADILSDRVMRHIDKFVPTTSFRDSRGKVWIGTEGNGLLCYDADNDSVCTVEGTSSNDIMAVIEDAQGSIWVSTLDGLNKYDRTISEFTSYYQGDGVAGNQFYDAAVAFGGGTLAFGGNHGITIFNTIEGEPHHNTKLLFGNLSIHNELVIPGPGKSIDRHLSYNPKVTLDHDQNTFSISFSTVEYSEYPRVHYFYRIEGYDNFWREASGIQEAHYSNIPPGNYTFRVKVTNWANDKVEAENALSITIKPSPWLSWWAILVYALTGCVIIYVFWRLWSRIAAQRKEAKRMMIEKEQEKKIREMNMSFFSNVSHEFRTPLTLMAGPVSTLRSSKTITDDSDKKLLRLIDNNVGRMLRLVNQMMDFHKLENDTLRLAVVRVDVFSQVQGVVELFSEAAKSKNITFATQVPSEKVEMLADADKIDKILSNLLSNAVKYTPQGGSITFAMDKVGRAQIQGLDRRLPQAEAWLRITVSDSGEGIPENQLEMIFHKYYQARNNDGHYKFGTGIGLYYARALAEIHHGVLYASNVNPGHGAMFTLLLPIDDDVYEAEAKGNRPDSPASVSARAADDADNVSEAPAAEVGNLPAMMVVDDEIDIARYIATIFKGEYNVSIFLSAEEALSALKQTPVDVVICDVMMPGMSGYDFCREVKRDSQTCHVPVVLVTAKTALDEQVEGLDTGAEGYVTKPFQPAYLKALVNTIIANRRRLGKSLCESTEIAADESAQLSPQDKNFMEELYALMEEMMGETEFDVDKATDRLHISRTKLYYKVKGLVGTTPAALFKSYKLNRAVALLREGKYNVSEVADITGFSTLAHFSSSFKKQFGKSPSEY